MGISNNIECFKCMSTLEKCDCNDEELHEQYLEEVAEQDRMIRREERR